MAKRKRGSQKKKRQSGMYTPWGVADYVRVIVSGFFEVETRGIRGYVLADTFAKKHLTEPARRRASRYGRLYAYAIYDGGWAILALELEQYRADMLIGHDLWTEPADYLEHVLSEYQPEYLQDRGIVPWEAEHRRWQQRRRASQLAEQRSPNLIVQGAGHWETATREVTLVTTADGSRHLVTTESYERLSPNLPLLSDCMLVSDAGVIGKPPPVTFQPSRRLPPWRPAPRGDQWPLRPIPPALADVNDAMFVALAAHRVLGDAAAKPSSSATKAAILSLEHVSALALRVAKRLANEE